MSASSPLEILTGIIYCMTRHFIGWPRAVFTHIYTWHFVIIIISLQCTSPNIVFIRSSALYNVMHRIIMVVTTNQNSAFVYLNRCYMIGCVWKFSFIQIIVFYLLLQYMTRYSITLCTIFKTNLWLNTTLHSRANNILISWFRRFLNNFSVLSLFNQQWSNFITFVQWAKMSPRKQ